MNYSARAITNELGQDISCELYTGIPCNFTYSGLEGGESKITEVSGKWTGVYSGSLNDVGENNQDSSFELFRRVVQENGGSMRSKITLSKRKQQKMWTFKDLVLIQLNKKIKLYRATAEGLIKIIKGV
tara:strand:+ start:6174 stop:6557 length:384 start_codon:yes stop_codon:yes gene_type:complete